MTTREATRYWIKPDLDIEPGLSAKLAVCAFGAIQWPWLLKSLFGGRIEDKRRLLDRLALPHDALPNLGSWKADTAFLTHIVDAIEMLRPATVVELGCGASSLVIGKALSLFGGGHLTSYDQHAHFAEATQAWLNEYQLRADVRYAPLGAPSPGSPGHWYQIDPLPLTIDMLVIDGPPWAIHPFVRGGAERLFSRLTDGAIILLDDAARPGERVVTRRWRKKWPGIEFRLDRSGNKGTLVGRKRA